MGATVYNLVYQAQQHIMQAVAVEAVATTLAAQEALAVAARVVQIMVRQEMLTQEVVAEVELLGLSVQPEVLVLWSFDTQIHLQQQIQQLVHPT
jgi:hypothetical protein